MSTSDQELTEAEGLAIFDDVREVSAEPAGVVGLQLVAVVLSYSFIIGVVVIAAVVLILAFTLFWPMLLAVVFPGATGLVTAGG